MMNSRIKPPTSTWTWAPARTARTPMMANSTRQPQPPLTKAEPHPFVGVAGVDPGSSVVGVGGGLIGGGSAGGGWAGGVPSRLVPQNQQLSNGSSRVALHLEQVHITRISRCQRVRCLCLVSSFKSMVPLTGVHPRAAPERARPRAQQRPAGWDGRNSNHHPAADVAVPGTGTPRSAGWQPALDVQAIRTVASTGTLAQPVCGDKPVRDRRSERLNL